MIFIPVRSSSDSDSPWIVMSAPFVKQSLEHLFYLCKLSEKYLYVWLSLKYVIPDFDFKTVKYVFFFWNCDVEYLVNNILILANCLIHKFRFF